MTQPTQATYVAPTGGRLAPVVSMNTTGLQVAGPDPLPKLRIWAAYPDGSSPESIEITYDADGPVTAELIAGILQALPGCTEDFHVSVTDVQPGALTRALNTANRSLKGTTL
jgi:hypothetical protein